MVFQNILFHNVAELEAGEKGHRMWRLPAPVRQQLNEGAREQAGHTTGVELRFVVTGDAATLTLRTDETEVGQMAYIYYGAFQGGWRDSAKVIGNGDTRITIPRAQNLETLRRITAERRLGFDPEVVRVVLPEGATWFVGVEGAVEPPGGGMLPDRALLAYGSSITHGSLSLATPYTYPFRIAQMLRCDHFNLGLAGSAQMERAMAEHIVSRADWAFATVEMGINMLELPTALFEERVKAFVPVLAADPRPVFATSVFGMAMDRDRQRKAAEYREIVRHHAEGRLFFTDGLALLDDPAMMAEDLVHPSLEGIAAIADHWCAIIRERLPAAQRL